MADMKFAKVLDGGTASYYSFTEDELAAVSKGETLLFSFVLRAPTSTHINITLDLGTTINYQDGSSTMQYAVPVQWTRIYMPVTVCNMRGVTLSTDGTVYIAEAKYEIRGYTAIDDLPLESGMWMIDEFESYKLSADGLGAGGSIGIVKSGDYIYSIGDSALTVTRLSDDKIVGRLDGLPGVRQIDVTKSGNYVLITARGNGVYVVDVSTPENPVHVTTYNSIEMATGLYISGDYAFVCNRQYGVEIVDITDPENPRHKANISDGSEVQSCVVYDNILYAGVWGECGVFMYDLSDLSDTTSLKKIGKVTTGGKGDGLTVTEIGGRKYLFAATGQHTYSANNENPLQNLCFGQGNGMDIFDVTDPLTPTWISTVKIDGRYYYTGNDYWETEVSYDEANDKYYAYLVNTYNGVYIYDVTDLTAPIRLAHIIIDLPLGTLSNGNVPALTHPTRTIVTTWDQHKTEQGPVGGISVADNAIYVAGTVSDLHKFVTPYAFAHSSEGKSAATLPNYSKDFYEFNNTVTRGAITALPDGSYQLIPTTGQALAAVTDENYVYVAAGAEGVIILNKSDLSRAGSIACIRACDGNVGFAQDVKIYADTLYVAANSAGLIAYDISGKGATAPVKLWAYTSGTSIARQVTVSPDGRFAVVQIDNASVHLVHCTDVTDSEGNVTKEKGTRATFYIEATSKSATCISASGGNIYHHQMTVLIDDRYVGIWNHISSEYWFDFGPDGARYDTPHLVSMGGTYTGSFVGGFGMLGGGTEYTDSSGNTYTLKVNGDGYVYISDDYTAGNKTKLFTSKLAFVGKPTVVGDYLIVCDRVSRRMAIYQISTETLLGIITFDGNPDWAYADGKIIYIPLGYQGMIKIDLAEVFA